MLWIFHNFFTYFIFTDFPTSFKSFISRNFLCLCMKAIENGARALQCFCTNALPLTAIWVIAREPEMHSVL